MTAYCAYISVCVLFSLIYVSDSQAVTVHGFAGQSVRLPCSYNIKYYGPLHICWGRGEIPLNGCKDQILATDGYAVTERVSHRYQLTGDLTKGDVSLTIVNTDEGDTGRYGCRIQIPGWFNDESDTVDLVIMKVRPMTTVSPPKTNTASTVQVESTSIPTHGCEDVTNTTETNKPDKYEEKNLLAMPYLALTAVAIVLFSVAVAVCLLLLKRNRCGKGGRTLGVTEHNGSPDLYVNFSADFGMDTRGSAVENVYECDSSNQYEFCP